MLTTKQLQQAIYQIAKLPLKEQENLLSLLDEGQLIDLAQVIYNIDANAFEDNLEDIKQFYA